MAKTKSKTKAKAKQLKTKAAKAAKTPGRSKSKAKKSKKKSKAKAVKVPRWRVACTSLSQIRQNIDRLDAAIVPLLCERLYFVTQAANFKPSVVGVVVPSRVEEIIASVRRMAEKLGTRPETIENVYRNIIDAFTADEQRHWAEINTQKRLSDRW